MPNYIQEKDLVVVPSRCPVCGKFHYFSMTKQDYKELNLPSLEQIRTDEQSDIVISDVCSKA